MLYGLVVEPVNTCMARKCEAPLPFVKRTISIIDSTTDEQSSELLARELSCVASRSVSRAGRHLVIACHRATAITVACCNTIVWSLSLSYIHISSRQPRRHSLLRRHYLQESDRSTCFGRHATATRGRRTPFTVLGLRVSACSMYSRPGVYFLDESSRSTSQRTSKFAGGI